MRGFPDEAAGLDYVYSGTDSIELHWTDEHGEKRETKLSWPQVAGIVQRLVDEGRYLEAPAVSQPVQQDEAQPFSGQYRLLDRLRTDCEYFSGRGTAGGKAFVGGQRGCTDRQNARAVCLTAGKTRMAFHRKNRRICPPYVSPGACRGTQRRTAGGNPDTG